jgi:hypothetical protein
MSAKLQLNDKLKLIGHQQLAKSQGALRKFPRICGKDRRALASTASGDAETALKVRFIPQSRKAQALR